MKQLIREFFERGQRPATETNPVAQLATAINSLRQFVDGATTGGQE